MIYPITKLSKDKLKELYIDNNMTAEQIAKYMGTTYGQVNYYINIYGLSRKANGIPNGLNIDRDLLYKYYFIDKLTIMNIATILNCSYQSVINYLHYYGFHRINGNDNTEYYQIVKDLYVNQSKSTTMISKELNIPKSRVRQILIQAGVKLRNKSECQQIFNTDYKSFDNDWSLVNDNLIKRCRSFFSNHIAPLIIKDHCEDCGATSDISVLHIHHKLALSIIIQQIRSENPNSSEDELYNIIINDIRFTDITNLKVVCENCHYTKYHPYAKFKLNRQSAAKPLYIEEGSTTRES